MKNPRSFWDTFESPYQMGSQKHRLYLLDLLEEKHVVSILDVGCGTGPIYEMIKNSDKWAFLYKGTDYSPAMIEIAQREFPEMAWEVQDARHLKEADNSWDCVLLMHCLDHLDDYKSAISEAARVASDYVLIVLWRPFSLNDNLNDRNMMGKEPGESPWEDTHLHEYNKNDLEKAFQEAGLTIEKEVFGEPINSGQSSYNYLFLLKKKKNEHD